MRGRVGRLAVIAVGVILVAGCAGTRPCLTIPMQLKLAQSDVKGYEKQVADKQADVDRMKSSLDMAQSRLQQLHDEEAELQRLIEAAKADSARKEGK
jgi:peptidoglycan hydrolase CwlO-like protein